MSRGQTPQPQGSLRQRNVPSSKKTAEAAFSNDEPDISKLAKAAQKKGKQVSERDHQIAFTVITFLAFLTRFVGISHPDEVVFDEVHFGKVSRPST